MGIFWFKSLTGILLRHQVQMFCIHSFSFMESSVPPLSCPLIGLWPSVIPWGTHSLSLASSTQGISCHPAGTYSHCTHCFSLKTFPYCGSESSPSFCLHQEVIHTAHTDTTFNNLYRLNIVSILQVLDPLLIALSYGVILHTVARLASKRNSSRPSAPLFFCAVLVFFVPMVGLSLIHRFGKHAPLAVHLFMANVYLFVPPMLNPIIYSIKTKEIMCPISWWKANAESWA